MWHRFLQKPEMSPFIGHQETARMIIHRICEIYLFLGDNPLTLYCRKCTQPWYMCIPKKWSNSCQLHELPSCALANRTQIQSTSRYIYECVDFQVHIWMCRHKIHWSSCLEKNMSLDMFGECVLNWSDLLFQANPEISKSFYLRLHH